ncbi:A24 family peptidase [Caenimonas koreensis]|uniref:Prepilin leader peptidase/N-methyltransferase n=1 Tax=Caenimonas koreensis DSM 17982 TaxID=1121255 RepID=A0A844B7M0_9BURK|nr:A24 family peptidase [Caenimonas koreensis]MRD47639.1 prepilin peptidase [Caenimonas koreensis DSM 17982]
MIVSPLVDAALAGVIGLLVGSFLNVVIYRLPMMMYRDWLDNYLDELVPADGIPGLWRLVFGPASTQPKPLADAATAALADVRALPALTLSKPRSRCPHCGAPIHWYQNIPVISWLALRGKCASCSARISVRYPIVELVTAGFFAFCVARFGVSLAAAFWIAFCCILICQFLIDVDTMMLPDALNYPLLWLGLIAAALKLTPVTLVSAVWGAVFGYLALWIVFHAYRLLTGKEGFGYGDFKLLAALGAWFGGEYLIAIILLSSIVGSIVGVGLVLAGRIANLQVKISYGPFLAATGLVAMILGPQGFHEYFAFAFPFDKY